MRIICTANGNLLKMVADGSFRDNLFYILRQTSISVPLLRESTEDIADIADYLLQRYTQKKQQSVILVYQHVILVLLSEYILLILHHKFKGT
ncbi:MAG: hypothetical protein K2H33_00200 [Muribaculaceae bacterium]|nr:hypothetical protein [Muribaculaceae bacterium]